MHKILIIDDEDTIRQGLRVIIERSNLTNLAILEAADGRAGLESIKKDQPDVVITDIRMPYLDGLDLIAEVHKVCLKRPIFIIISGYDDFNYAKRAIKYGVKEYLLKPVVKDEFLLLLQNIIHELDDNVQRFEAELVKNLQSKVGMELLKEKYFVSLIHGTYFDEKSVLKQLLQLGVNFAADQFKVLVAEYRPRNQETMRAFDEMDRFALKELIDEGISGVIKEFWSFYDTALRLIVIICNPESFLIETHIKKICEQITRTFNLHQKADTFFGVGNTATGLTNIKESYDEALNLALYKIIREPGGIVFNKDLGEEDSRNMLSFVNFPKLSGEIELGMKKTVAMLLDESFKQMDWGKGPVARLIEFYNEFNKYMYNYFTEKGLDFSMIFDAGEDDFRELDTFWAVDEMKDYLKEYLNKIADLISSYKSASPDRKIIEQVIRYMRENYDKEINLNIVANHFGMERAKELLAQNRLKIQEIAGKVGYPNAKHFCMVFKKMIGISPTEYREKCIS